MRLGVIADTRHHLDDLGRLCTIEAVAAQTEQWADMFDEVVLLAPLWPGPPPAGFRAYRRDNVSILPLRRAGGRSIRAKAHLALQVPGWSLGIARLSRRVDAVHLRAPCNVALLGIVVGRFARWHRSAMYAGNWQGYGGEPLSYRAQRRLLAHPSFGGPVTVYAEQAPDSPHLVPFFSPSFTLEDWEAESEVVEAKLSTLDARSTVPAPVRLVSVGHLESNKNHEVVLEAVRALRGEGIDARLDVVGDGPLLDRLTQRRDALGLHDAVRLRGRLPLASVRQCYRDAHFNVLASRTEGYPKVVAEGMVCGAVPVTSRFPMSGAVLGAGERGATFPCDDPAALARAISTLVDHPASVAGMIAAGRAYARTVTLDAFGVRLHEVLEAQWGVCLPRGQAAATAGPS